MQSTQLNSTQLKTVSTGGIDHGFSPRQLDIAHFNAAHGRTHASQQHLGPLPAGLENGRPRRLDRPTKCRTVEGRPDGFQPLRPGLVDRHNGGPNRLGGIASLDEAVESSLGRNQESPSALASHWSSRHLVDVDVDVVLALELPCDGHRRTVANRWIVTEDLGVFSDFYFMEEHLF